MVRLFALLFSGESQSWVAQAGGWRADMSRGDMDIECELTRGLVSKPTIDTDADELAVDVELAAEIEGGDMADGGDIDLGRGWRAAKDAGEKAAGSWVPKGPKPPLTKDDAAETSDVASGLAGSSGSFIQVARSSGCCCWGAS